MDPSLLISKTALDRIEEFSDEFSQAFALSPVEPWAAQLGYIRSGSALLTRWPIPLDAAGYREFKGDFKFRSLYGRELSLKTKTWSDGVEVDEAKLADPSFIGWNDAPANMALEWQRLPNQITAAMLEANPRLGIYDDPDSETAGSRTLFASDHPFNVIMPEFGTYDNDIQTTRAKLLNGEFFEDITEYFGNMKGPNGQSMGLDMAGGTFLTNYAEKELFRKALNQQFVTTPVDNAGALHASANVVAAVQEENRFKGFANHVAAHELTSANVFYAIAAPKPGNHVWVGEQESAPTEIRHDYQSELYKRHLKLGIALHGRANVGACLPTRIVRVTFTG